MSIPRRRTSPESFRLSTMFTVTRRVGVSLESTRTMRAISLTTSHEDSMGSTRCSLSGRLRRSTNSPSSCTRITERWCPRSSASKRRIIRPLEKSLPTQDAISRPATDWAVLGRALISQGSSAGWFPEWVLRRVLGHDEFVFWVPYDENRTRCFSDDFFGHAAHHQMSGKAVTMRSHDDQIDLALPGIANDLDVR